MKQLTITKEELYDLYINRNLSAKEIAIKYNISRSCVNTALKSFNISKPKELSILKQKEIYDKKSKQYKLNISEKRKQTNKKKYGTDNPFSNKDTIERIKKIKKEKYGIIDKEQLERYYLIENKTIEELKLIFNCTKYKLIKYINEYQLQKPKNFINVRHLSKETLDIISDKEKLKDFILNSDNKNGYYLAEKLGYGQSSLYLKLHEYGLYDLLDHSSSKYEQEIKEYFYSKNIKLEKTRKELDGLEIDLYDPIHKIGIEFNGKYWHSDNILKDKFYHQKKSLLAESKGITLFHIWEYEWLFNKNKILMMLDNLFGFSNVIYARNCKIVEIPAKDKSKFLNDNHLQGNDGSSINLALVHNNILVSVMTFCKPRFNKNYEWELSRFCNLRNTRVIGGASKLFKYFISKYKPNSIISYSNISKTTGKMYSKLGFKLERISDPNYVWIDSSFNIKTRYQCQMKNEKQIMEDRGYFRIYDCGNKVWIWKNNIV